MLQQHPLFSHLSTVFLHTVTCGSFRLCSLLANSLLAVFAFTIASHTVAPGSFHCSQSYTRFLLAAFVFRSLPVHGCFSSIHSPSAFFAVILHTVACGSFRFCNLLTHSRPLAVFASVIASHTVAPDSFRYSQSYTRLLLAACPLAYSPSSSPRTQLPLAAFAVHSLTHGCSWQRSFSQSSCTWVLQQHPLSSCPFAVVLHIVAHGSFRFCNLLVHSHPLAVFAFVIEIGRAHV